MLDRLAQGALVGVAVEAQAFMRDAARAQHRRGFHHHQAVATHGELAQMKIVPVRSATVLGLVLAHRRNHDAVVERHAAQSKGRKQLTHRYLSYSLSSQSSISRRAMESRRGRKKPVLLRCACASFSSERVNQRAVSNSSGLTVNSVLSASAE